MLRWDIYCKVIDNHGDLGVCWRLACHLAETGQHGIRLVIDQPQDLGWMAPQGHPSIQVLRWPLPTEPFPAFEQNADVVIEAFGCQLPQSTEAWLASPEARSVVWINLEYLSAETYVERSHQLPSPVLQGPAKGCTKFFYFPGFNRSTGGLLRQPGAPLPELRTGPIQTACLFCYQPEALTEWLNIFAELPNQPQLNVTAGRSRNAVETAIQNLAKPDQLNIHYLPFVSQTEFDAMLYKSDFNLVRGEDSLVSALWAGQPWVWQAYPQHDHAHFMKIEALLNQLQAPNLVRQWHHRWNGFPDSQALQIGSLTGRQLQTWRQWACDCALNLRKIPPLAQQLIEFVKKKR
jgi:hypothetical protein